MEEKRVKKVLTRKTRRVIIDERLARARNGP